MEKVIHRLALDLERPGSSTCLTVRRGDSARTLVVTLSQGGRPYRISDGVTPVFYARKSDRVPLFNHCTVEQNTIRYDFTGQTTNVVGPVECEIKLYGPDMELLTSAPFDLMIEDTIQQEGDIPDSSPEYTALTELVAKGTALIGNLEGLSEELLPIADEVRRNAHDAETAAMKAVDSAKEAETAKNTVVSLASHADDAARRAEEAAERAEGLTGGCATREDVEEIWAEIRYVPIAISNFRHSAGTVELGTVLESVGLSWVLNKDPAQQSLNGVLIPSTARAVTAPGPFDKTTKFSLAVTDERGAPDTASTTVYFYNAVYYGTHTGTAMPTDEQLRALPKNLQSGKGLDLKGNAGVGQYLIYACPTSYGTPEFWYNGIQGGFYKLGTMLHTNASGHKENYDIWLSGADELGTRTITVK